MNLLAHSLLAHVGLPDTGGLETCGALMADYYGGRDLGETTVQVAAGIRQHRSIDSFTDSHPVSKEARMLLSAAGAPRFSAGILLDLFWDNILGSDWDRWGAVLCGHGLEDFAQLTYRRLEATAAWHVGVFPRLLPWLIAEDWLSSYARIEGIAKSLRGIGSRLPHGKVLIGCEVLLVEHREELADCFARFWPDLLREFYK